MEQVWESLSVLWISPLADTLAGILWCFLIGAVIAAGYTVYRRNTLGTAIAALTAAKAFTEETAKTAEDLGLAGAGARALKSRDRLIEKTDGERYYLPEARRKKAEALLKSGRTPLWQIPLLILALYALLLVLHALIPWIQNAL